MEERVYRVVSQIMNVPVEQVNKASSPSTIEAWDSLNHMNLVLALEEEFGVQFDDEDIVNMNNLELILATIKKNMKND